jgi:hypothetical protein
MYKNFNLTESEKEQILNRLKENGYGQPINEQNAPVKKPVAPQQGPKGINPNGKPDMELVKKINTLKEFLQAYLNNVETYVSKTNTQYGIMVNTQSTKSYVDNSKPTRLECIFLKVTGGYYERNLVQFYVGSTGSGVYSAKDGGNTIVGDLLASKDLNDLYQNLNKYSPEVYTKVQTIGLRPDLQIEIYNNQDKQPLDNILMWFQSGDVKKDIEVFQSVYPNFKENLWQMYDYNKSMTLNKAYEEANNERDYTKRKQFNTSLQQSRDYFRQRDREIKDLLGMDPNQDKYVPKPAQGQQPAKPDTPVQGQQPAAKPAPQKPLNEGQEILMDVFKNLIK